jgi:hypothetical protein
VRHKEVGIAILAEGDDEVCLILRAMLGFVQTAFGGVVVFEGGIVAAVVQAWETSGVEATSVTQTITTITHPQQPH